MANLEEVFNAMVLSRINYFNLVGLLELYRSLGSATEVMRHRMNIREVLPDASDRLAETLRDLDEPMRRAEQEMAFCEAHKIQVLPFNSPLYPQRLRECADAPLTLFYRGNADLNARHTINLIGTRHATAYGKDFVAHFLAELKTLCPDTLVFSGLAYGIDIAAHRASLTNGFATVGVLAHGLDEIYPRTHRATAIEMVNQGGLLTEYMSHTRAEKMNFVRRNRIVAGCSDATLLIESANKGGGLITCDIARSYGREVFALPGNVTSHYSEGCNRLLRDNQAAVFTSAKDLVTAMGWQDEAQRSQLRKRGIEPDLFPTLNEQERQIVELLTEHGDLQLSMLAAQTGETIAQLSGRLFDMEMRGIIRSLAGGTYHLVGK